MKPAPTFADAMMPRHWKPLWRTEEFTPIRQEVVNATMQGHGISEAEARALLDADHAKCRYWVNDLYQVQVRPCGPDGTMLHICIRRRDGSMFKDWRHFQQIKNEVAGAEREAIEMYPAESRKVDTSNKWHLWVLPEGKRIDIGWQERDVQYDEYRNVPGLRQRAL
jgi:hypothetical protein